MNTTTVSVAEPASSYRDDPGPSTAPTTRARSSAVASDASGDAAAADAEPPEPAGQPANPPDVEPDFSVDAADDLTCEIDFLWLDGQLRSAAIHLPLPIERVSIRIVGDCEMTDLNRRFHDADETTDVLTFLNSADGEPIDADLALCADEASRQAAERGHAIERELLLYTLHGLLHCCGFDDTDDESFAAMHAEEDRILSAIGVGATFATKKGTEVVSSNRGQGPVEGERDSGSQSENDSRPLFRESPR